ncbi:hypothetical protein ACX3X3_13570 [Bacillus subtilis]|uniref:hypothetical protein n=1 Tax=Bacillus subtilis TaxID=1423 RepID=UPI00164EFA92|nr:hypothetical protein [Bacillus subtilis]HEQ3553570.1 hypothetical protein [Enterococcus faecalis]
MKKIKLGREFFAVLPSEPGSVLSESKWRTALVVGRTVNEAKTIWNRVKSNYPSYKYTKFVSRNPCGIDGINAENVTLYMLPGYTENPIIKNPHFQWLIQLAAEVIYVRRALTNEDKC